MPLADYYLFSIRLSHHAACPVLSFHTASMCKTFTCPVFSFHDMVLVLSSAFAKYDQFCIGLSQNSTNCHVLGFHRILPVLHLAVTEYHLSCRIL